MTPMVFTGDSLQCIRGDTKPIHGHFKTNVVFVSPLVHWSMEDKSSASTIELLLDVTYVISVCNKTTIICNYIIILSKIKRRKKGKLSCNSIKSTIKFNIITNLFDLITVLHEKQK